LAAALSGPAKKRRRFQGRLVDSVDGEQEEEVAELRGSSEGQEEARNAGARWRPSLACRRAREGEQGQRSTAAREEGEVAAAALTECTGERAAAALTTTGAMSGVSAA
jgi:hypothetical protein